MNKLYTLALFVLMTACAQIPQKPVIIVAPTVPIVLPTVTPIVVQPIQWKVYNSTELEALGKQLSVSKTEMIIFTMDSTNFKNLNLNLVDIKRYIMEQRTLIEFLIKARNRK